MHIDEASLYSIIDKETKTPREFASGGHINPIKAHWELPSDPEDLDAIDEALDTNDPLDEAEEELDGCKMRDVGWINVCLTDLMSNFSQDCGSGDLRHILSSTAGDRGELRVKGD